MSADVHNLTLKGQGQWPVAGAEETVMQSTVILTCIRGSGGFYFATSHNITVEGLTIVNCGRFSYNSIAAVMYFNTVNSLVFRKNSIQHMTGYGSWFFTTVTMLQSQTPLTIIQQCVNMVITHMVVE